MNQTYDVIIVGTGVSGLFCALNLPEDRHILMITKDTFEHSDSFLAQGGICVLKDAKDYEPFYTDTMCAGHYRNTPESVDVMIRSSQETIRDLLSYGVEFQREGDAFAYTKEGAHSRARILYHEDLTGKEITGKLLAAAQARPNISLLSHTTLVDLLSHQDTCKGAVLRDQDGTLHTVQSDYVILATGGIGGLYEHSTNYSHLTGDAIAIALRHKVALKDIQYVQIHPTSLYSTKPGRRFLISESVRGEGAILLNAEGRRFVDELLPRDVLTQKIQEQMRLDDKPHVWLSLKSMTREQILRRFPNIYEHCQKEGYDLTCEPIPVTPAQHYFMGGIRTNTHGQTSMERLLAVGETSCNGVHGANRLASNSLLESLVFAKRTALHLANSYTSQNSLESYPAPDPCAYGEDYQNENKSLILKEIERNQHYESYHHAVKCG